MVPILSAQQVRDADAFTVRKASITSLELMERAASRCAQRIVQFHREGSLGPTGTIEYLVLAGMGNNGGDGLAIARLLKAAGLDARVVRINHATEASPDNTANLLKAKEMGIAITELAPGEDLKFEQHDIVIDALFGTGLSRPLDGWLAGLVKQVNARSGVVIAIDMPSGLFAEDNAANDRSAIVRATITFTFKVPKLAQLLAENAAYIGQCEVVSIGLDSEYLASLKTDHYFLQEQDVIELLPPRPQHGHKGTFGHALIMAGSYGKAGAAVLAVNAALRSGTGLVSAFVPRSAVNILQITAPETMCIGDEKEHLSDLPELGAYSAIGLGPGVGTSDDTSIVIKKLIQSASSKLVLDADALNILSANPTWLAFLPPNTILTPHPKEFDRLHGSPAASDHERCQNAREMARKLGCIVVLKGARTAICDPAGKVFFNSNGNPGMAKGGSGDALTGLMTGLLAQRMAPLQAAILSVHLHGSAGDIAAEHRGMDGMTVKDLIKALPEAWKRLRNASDEIFSGALPFAKDTGFTL